MLSLCGGRQLSAIQVTYLLHGQTLRKEKKKTHTQNKLKFKLHYGMFSNTIDELSNERFAR